MAINILFDSCITKSIAISPALILCKFGLLRKAHMYGMKKIRNPWELILLILFLLLNYPRCAAEK